MSSSIVYSVKELSKAQNRTIAFYLQQLSLEFDNYRECAGFQDLYKGLVAALGLKEHSKLVIKSVIDAHIKAKVLTVNGHGKNKAHYKEDSDICKKCGKWKTGNGFDANLVRAVFAGSQEWFSWIVAFTFFVKPDKRRTTFDIYGNYPIDAVMKKADCLPKDSFVQFLVDEFDLSKIDAKILNVAYLRKTVREFKHLFSDINDNWGSGKSVVFTASCLRLPLKKVFLRLCDNTKLISYELVDEDGDITFDARKCILYHDISLLFSDVLTSDDRKNYIPLKIFPTNDKEIKLASKFLKNSSTTNLLIYGRANTGKTELARSLVRSLGLKPLFLKDDFDPDCIRELSKMLTLPKKTSVIIIEDAENVLDADSSSRKKRVEKMLEESRSKVIWIANSLPKIDESVLRYFTYSIKLKDMNPEILKTVENTKNSKSSNNTKFRTKLLNICEKYSISGDSVEHIVNTFSSMKLNSYNEEQIMSDMKAVLESNTTLFCDRQRMRGNIQNSYDLSVLNASVPPQEIVDMVINAQECAEKNEASGGEGGIRMLFYGLSGTGKTELARYIAKKLHKRILTRRASDILGMYVGDEEKNIRQAFEEAEELGNILLFDEADTFFADRSFAKQNWERSMVNEFLTQMEEFSGILICTTNLRQIMDPAMQRRFHILAEFKALRPDGIAKLLKSFFGTYTFDDALISPLVRYNTVTPGDFGSLSGKIRFMPQDKITPQLIIDELCKIQEEKGSNSRSIGFAG